jgi:hypothetical protein
VGARINLVVLKSANVLFVESMTPLRVESCHRCPFTVASGKLLLAFGPPEMRESVLRSASFVLNRRPRSCCTPAMAREHVVGPEMSEDLLKSQLSPDIDLILGEIFLLFITPGNCVVSIALSLIARRMRENLARSWYCVAVRPREQDYIECVEAIRVRRLARDGTDNPVAQRGLRRQ